MDFLLARIVQIDGILDDFANFKKEGKIQEGLGLIEIELEKSQSQIILSIVQDIKFELDFQKKRINVALIELPQISINEADLDIDQFYSDTKEVEFKYY
jgi:hypothetical protein